MVRVLIAYATRAGSTADVAAIIADRLREEHCDVTVAEYKDQPDPDPYDIVIAGSAIHMQAWLSEATAWLRLHEAHLRNRPVAIFNVCMGAAEADKPGKYEECLGYNNAAKKIIEPVAEATFAGRYTPAKVGWFARILFKAQQTKPKDYIEPDKVRAWATSILAETAV